jgi:hypothetical protein
MVIFTTILDPEPNLDTILFSDPDPLKQIISSAFNTLLLCMLAVYTLSNCVGKARQQGQDHQGGAVPGLGG